jgi:hypothetical protein
MPIMPDAKLIEKVPPGLANFLIGPLSLDHPRNKILLLFPRSKWSMLPLIVVVHNYFRCETLKDYSYTINQVPLLCANESDIKIAYNPWLHFRTKHIDI